MLAQLIFNRLGGSTSNAYSYLNQQLLAPLGMRHTIVEADPSGVFVGSSYVYASARDWARLGNLLVANGTHEGQQLLDAEWVARATTPNPSANDPRYGYQLWLNSGGDQPLRWPELPADAFAMQGNRAQVVMMIPSKNAVFVRLGWSATGYPTSEVFGSWLQAL